MSRYTRIDVTAEVYVSEILDELDSEELIDELKRRGHKAAAIDPAATADLRRAYDALLARRPNDALAILDRVLHERKAIDAAYLAALGRRDPETGRPLI